MSIFLAKREAFYTNYISTYTILVILNEEKNVQVYFVTKWMNNASIANVNLWDQQSKISKPFLN